MDHPHDHDHDGHAHGAHGHAHHAPADGITTRMAIAVTLNLLFVVIEGGFGYLSNSVALIADAGHNLATYLGCCVRVPPCIWPAARRAADSLTDSAALRCWRRSPMRYCCCSRAAPSRGKQWGGSRAPPTVAGTTVIGVAASRHGAQRPAAWLLHGGSHDDLNRRSAFIHMLGDAAVSAGVLMSAPDYRLHRLEPIRSGGQLVDRRSDTHEHLGPVARLVALCRSTAYPRASTHWAVMSYLAGQRG